jgi:hypothetical protein
MSDGLKCPKCKSDNTQVINPILIFSDDWKCENCGCIFREYYTHYENGIITNKGYIEILSEEKHEEKPMSKEWVKEHFGPCSVCEDKRRRPYVGNCPDDCDERNRIMKKSPIGLLKSKSELKK